MLDLCRRGRGTDQHSIAARSVDQFDDELFEIFESVAKRGWIAATPSFDIWKPRFFASIISHDLGHVRVYRLVVGDPCPRRVHDRHVAGSVSSKQAGYA